MITRASVLLSGVSFLREKALLLFIIFSCFITWIIQVLEARYHSPGQILVLLNLFIAIAGLIVFGLIDEKKWIQQKFEAIVLSLSFPFVMILVLEVYLHGFNQKLLTLLLIYLAIVTANLSSFFKVALFLGFSFGSLFYFLFSLGFNLTTVRIDLLIFLVFNLSLVFGYVLAISLKNRKKLERSEALLIQKAIELDMILNNLPFHVSYKDKENRFIRVNKGVADFLNTTPEELEGKSLYNVFPREVAERYHDEDREVIDKKAAVIGLVDEITPMGQKGKIWLKCHKIPHFDERGEVIGVIVCAEDISLQMESKKKLYAVEQRFRQIFDFAAYGMLLFNAILEPFIKSNIKAQFLLGYTAKELKKRCMKDIMHPHDWLEFSKGIENKFNQEGSVYNEEVRIISANGTVMIVDLTINVIIENDGDSFIYAILKDVTNKKESEKRLKMYSRQLEESNQNLKEFAYAASHDLKEPLRTIISYIQLLKRKLPPDLEKSDIYQFMHFIEDGSKRMDKLIAALLEYSRIGNGDLKFDKLDTVEVLASSCRELSQMIIENDAIIEWDELPVIDGDKIQMSILFTNLLSNAIKYRNPDSIPHIRISSSDNDKEYLFAIEDNGIGIKEEYLELIFAVFRRLHSMATIPGTGIGLASCRRIVQRHGGTIWASSTFGNGSTFYFTIPKLNPSYGIEGLDFHFIDSNGDHSSRGNGH